MYIRLPDKYKIELWINKKKKVQEGKERKKETIDDDG